MLQNHHILQQQQLGYPNSSLSFLDSSEWLKTKLLKKWNVHSHVATSLCSSKLANGMNGRLTSHTFMLWSSSREQLAIWYRRCGRHLMRPTDAIVWTLYTSWAGCLLTSHTCHMINWFTSLNTKQSELHIYFKERHFKKNFCKLILLTLTTWLPWFLKYNLNLHSLENAT